MQIRAYRYSLPFKVPLRLKAGSLTEKDGFVLRIDHDGKTGWGDISPLDGYSPETFSQVAAGLESELNTFLNEGAAYEGNSKLPSIVCGIQFASDSLDAEALSSTSIETACLLNDTSSDSLRAAAMKAISDGHRCLKIKVGRNTVGDDIGQIRALQEILPDDVSLRLDANRAWSLEQALQFTGAVSPDRVSFIEEPLSNDAAYVEYDKQGRIPFAFDESLKWRPGHDLGTYRNLAALILKPTVLGGPRKVAEWAQLAESHDLDCVVSAMYESGVGMRSLLQLASGQPYSRTVAGLDTYSAFKYDIVAPALELSGGSFLSGGAWELDLEKVELIYDSN